MPRTFDVDVWTERASASKERALSRSTSGASRAAVYRKYFEDLRAITGIQRIIDWATRRHVTVVFGNETCQKCSTLYVDSRIPIRNQLHMLLHEAGHFLIDTSHDPGDMYPNGYRHGKRSTNSNLHFIDVVAEEIDAWRRGRRLASRIGIDLDRDAFDALRARSVKTYLMWASRSGAWAPTTKKKKKSRRRQRR